MVTLKTLNLITIVASYTVKCLTKFVHNGITESAYHSFRTLNNHWQKHAGLQELSIVIDVIDKDVSSELLIAMNWRYQSIPIID